MSDSEDASRREAVAVRAANAGAAVAIDSFRSALTVEQKAGKTDVVTQADRDAQQAVIEVIEEACPGEAIVGEEDDALKRVPESGAAWIVDPIDGTNNYVNESRAFGTAVAAVLDGEPVAGASVFPALGDSYHVGPSGPTRNGDPISVSDRTDPECCTVCPTFWWAFDNREQYGAATQAIVKRFGDLRRPGCAQLELAMVASGTLDGVATNLETNSWDTVVGVHAIREAGGTVTDLNGNRWRHDSRGLVASNGEIHDAVLDAAQQIESR